MSSGHDWELKTTGTVKTSSLGATHFAGFQCRTCNLAATSRLTNKQECRSAVIPEPDVDEPCEPEGDDE